MANPFIYNPSAAIEKTSKKTSDGIASAMDLFVKEREQSFNFIKDKVDNLEKLKEDATRYNREHVYANVAELEATVVGALGKNSKVDLSKLGGIQTQINSLKNVVKNGKDAPAQYENFVKMIGVNQANMYNGAITMQNMEKLLYDPKNFSDPAGLNKKLMGLFNDGTDPMKLLSSNLSSALNLAHIKPTTTTYRAKDGSTKSYTSINNGYVFFNPETEKTELVEVINSQGQKVSKISEDYKSIIPPELEEMFKRIFGGAVGLPGFDLKSKILEKVADVTTSLSQLSVKQESSADQNRTAGSQADILWNKAKYSAANEIADLNKKKIDLNNAILGGQLTAVQIQKHKKDIELLDLNVKNIEKTGYSIGTTPANTLIPDIPGANPSEVIGVYKFNNVSYTKIVFKKDGTALGFESRSTPNSKGGEINADDINGYINSIINPAENAKLRAARDAAMSGAVTTTSGGRGAGGVKVDWKTIVDPNAKTNQ